MFADDTSLTSVGETLGEVEERTNEDLMNVRKWMSGNKLSLNIAKTEYVLINWITIQDKKHGCPI